MVTMSEVAKAAGVSRATASYALRNDPRIVSETAQKVLAAAEKLDYTANLSARSLRSGRNGVIGVAIFELDKAYPSQMSAAISQEANRRGLQAIVQQTSNCQEGEIAVLKKVTSQLCDGTIFSSGHVSPEEIKELSADKPMVLLDDIPDDPIFDSVFTPCEEGAAAAVRHLIETGCRNIVVMGADYMSFGNIGKTNSVSIRRLTGALKAFEDAGMHVDNGNFVRLDKWDSESGRSCVHRLVSEGRSFDGLFCMTDSVAIGALRGLADCGIRVPQDVSVIGFDGVYEGEFTVPTLSTIRVDIEDLARKAVSLLTKRISENDKVFVPEHLTARFNVVSRESTRWV